MKIRKQWQESDLIEKVMITVFAPSVVALTLVIIAWAISGFPS